MADLSPTDVTNLDIYGSSPLPWDRPHDILAAPPKSDMPGGDHPSFLGTVRPDGRPHAAGVGARWHDGDLYFTSSPRSQKSHNLAANPACTISLSLPGIDLVVEGTATIVHDRETLETLAALYREGGWPAEVEGEALRAPFSAPSAGPPPWELYRVEFHTAFGVATAEPYGATRWRFDR
jgi:hypothetical protein